MLDKNKLRKSIESAFLEAKAKTDNPEEAIEVLSEQIANAIDDYIRSLDITYTSGLIAGTYAVTGIFNYTLS
jgi:hypothetical protein